MGLSLGCATFALYTSIFIKGEPILAIKAYSLHVNKFTIIRHGQALPFGRDIVLGVTDNTCFFDIILEQAVFDVGRMIFRNLWCFW